MSNKCTSRVLENVVHVGAGAFLIKLYIRLLLSPIYAAKNFTKRGDRSVRFVVGDRLWDYVVCLRRLSVFLLFTMWSYCIRRRSAEACFRKGTKARADFDGFLHDGAGWH